jgi:hypothetical protein
MQQSLAAMQKLMIAPDDATSKRQSHRPKPRFSNCLLLYYHISGVKL